MIMNDKPAENEMANQSNDKPTNSSHGDLGSSTQSLAADKTMSAEDASNTDYGMQPPSSPFINIGENIGIDNNLEVKTTESQKDSFTSNPIVGPHTNGGGRGFKIFVTLGILVTLIVWAAVGYIYMQNNKMKKESPDISNLETMDQITPTPAFDPNQIKIRSGNIVNEKPGGETVVLVDKKDYPSTGITGFLKLAVSPNNQKICFESWSPAPEPALYISNIDGQNVLEVSPNRQNCLWSNDSNTIYYINIGSNTSPVNIFSYDINEGFEKDMTSESVPAGVVRRFELVGMSADGSSLICRYENLGGAAKSETITECRVDIETGVVSEL